MNTRLTEKLAAFGNDHLWIKNNFNSLLKKYENQWIAVKNGNVIANDPDLTSLKTKLPDPAHTCVEYVTQEPLEMVL